jgi:hypothetical protein
MKILFFIFFFTFCSLTAAVGQKIIYDSKKEKTITVKGRVVTYKVLKPEFWKAMIDPYSGYSEYVDGNEVVHYQSVIEIYKNKPNDFERGGVIIAIRNIEKYGKQLTDAFQNFLRGYEVKFGKAEKEEAGVKSSKYESVSNLIHTADTASGINQCIVFIDPGKTFKYDIIISMLISHQRTKPTEEEMAIFRKIVNSFRMLKG